METSIPALELLTSCAAAGPSPMPRVGLAPHPYLVNECKAGHCDVFLGTEAAVGGR